jgi:hypothetical protein
MQKRIAVLLIALAATSCRHHKEETAATGTSDTAAAAAQSGSPLVGRTQKVDESSSVVKHLGPDVGTDMPSPGAIVNVPALVGRSRERINATLGEPEDKAQGLYRVSGQPVKIYFDHADRATWFEMQVPWPVMNAVDALRLLSIEAVNIVPEQESEERVDYIIDFSGVELDGKTVSKLNAVATKPQTAAEWTDVGAGIRRPGFP